jgi:antitoxin YefM
MEVLMPIQTTYTHARANLAKLLDEVTKNHETVVITRRGSEDVAIISASELSSLTETAHLLRSPKNAGRLLRALTRAMEKQGKPQRVNDLRREVGFEEAP